MSDRDIAPNNNTYLRMNLILHWQSSLVWPVVVASLLTGIVSALLVRWLAKRVPEAIQRNWDQGFADFLERRRLARDARQTEPGTLPFENRKPLAHQAIVAALTILAAAVVFARFGIRVEAIPYLIFAECLVLICVINVTSRLIPDVIVIPLTWGGLGCLVVLDQSRAADLVFGALVGYLVPLGVFLVFKWVKRIEILGFGDIKVFGVIGAWLGFSGIWQAMLVYLLAVIVCAVFGALVLRHKSPMPTGPAYLMTGLICLSGILSFI